MNIKHLHEAPSLTTALVGPLHALESRLLAQHNAIESWLRRQWRRSAPPFYASVDIRNAGFKVAPVDTNLFPAGFNNINRDFAPLIIQAAQAALDIVCPDAVRILILPEEHTRNRHYLDSVATLRELLLQAGYETQIGALNAAAPPAAPSADLSAEVGIDLRPVSRRGNRLYTADGFDPCAILLNNDLSSGVPEILRGLEQTVMPPPDLGWSRRLKSGHFEFYRALAREFAELIDMDAWFFDPLFRNCGEIDFMQRQGEECLAEHTALLLADIKKKYRQYRIDAAPYVVIKADAGTYGMGVMMVRSAAEVLALNRKQRTRMARSKGGNVISRVILQEGVPTFETWGQSAAKAVAEPVVYLVDRYVVGGFYRVHTKRGADENLNAPGMHFEPLGFGEPCNTPRPQSAADAAPNRFYTYGVIARLALLAAAREIAAVNTPAAAETAARAEATAPEPPAKAAYA